MAGPSNQYSFEKQIERFLEETENDVEVLGGESSDEEEDEVQNSDHNSDTEQSAKSDIEDNAMDNVFPPTDANEPSTTMDIEFEGRPETLQSDLNYSKECRLELNIDEYNSDEDDVPFAKRVMCYYGKPKKNRKGEVIEPGCKWYRKPPPQNVRTPARNLVIHLPGVKGEAKNATTPLQAWNILFSNDIIYHIVACTNKYIDIKKEDFSRERDAIQTSFDEVKALIGILYICGAMKSSHKNTLDIWAKDGTGIDLVISTMSRNRFHFLLRCLRFDDPPTRTNRRKLDKITHIREIFEIFVSNCKSSYTISEYATIDEKLEAFRGRCSFRQYIKNKPAKYGIKIFMLCDSRTFYTSNMEIYAGSQPEGPFEASNSAKDVVERLVQPISGTNRNVTMDNWFTSIPLSIDLLKNHKLTMVGTIRTDKREVPLEFSTAKKSIENTENKKNSKKQKKKTEHKEICSSMFGFHEEKITLVSYVPKKNKVVLALSTMHYDNSIDESTGEEKKPEVITFYNMTKGGVDVVDRMCNNYGVGRACNRWPLTVFYCMLVIAGINSQIIHDSNKKEQILRRHYLKTLGKELLMPYLVARSEIVTLPRDLKTRIKLALGLPQREPMQQIARKNARCDFCPRNLDRKTTKCCANCGKSICKDHVVETCVDCFNV